MKSTPRQFAKFGQESSRSQLTPRYVCSYCSKSYDDDEHVPKLVPSCGHTFCLECVNCIILQNKGVCFTCPVDQ